MDRFLHKLCTSPFLFPPCCTNPRSQWLVRNAAGIDDSLQGTEPLPRERPDSRTLKDSERSKDISLLCLLLFVSPPFVISSPTPASVMHALYAERVQTTISNEPAATQATKQTFPPSVALINEPKYINSRQQRQRDVFPRHSYWKADRAL